MIDVESFSTQFSDDAWPLFQDFLHNLSVLLENSNIELKKRDRILKSLHEYVREYLDEQDEPKANIQLTESMLLEIGSPMDIINIIEGIPRDQAGYQVEITLKRSVKRLFKARAVIFVFLFFYLLFGIVQYFLNFHGISALNQESFSSILFYTFINLRVVLAALSAAGLIELFILMPFKQSLSVPTPSRIKLQLFQTELVFLYPLSLLGLLWMVAGLFSVSLLFERNEELNNKFNTLLLLLFVLLVLLAFTFYLWNYSNRPHSITYFQLIGLAEVIQNYTKTRWKKRLLTFIGLIMLIFLDGMYYGWNDLFGISTPPEREYVSWILVLIALIVGTYPLIRDMYYYSWVNLSKFLLTMNYGPLEVKKIEKAYYYHPVDILIDTFSSLSLIFHWFLMNLTVFVREQIYQITSLMILGWLVGYIILAILITTLIQPNLNIKKPLKEYFLRFLMITSTAGCSTIMLLIQTDFFMKSLLQFLLIVGLTFLIILYHKRPVIKSYPKSYRIISFFYMMYFMAGFYKESIFYHELLFGIFPLFIIPFFFLVLTFIFLNKKYPEKFQRD
ncbi:MAG: hypothetical protein EAX86_09530 [Candidatus Heimdallarchaeota archaeon]|nr:hypothetical protein [Candidatus Heimdallarchaeota archaeon]